MKNNNQFYAIESLGEDGKKRLCWKERKHLYFADKAKGFNNPPPPTLFRSKQEARRAIKEAPESGANLKRFQTD